MEAVNWLPIIAAGASVVAVVKFWVELGKLWRQVEDTGVTVAAQAGKFALLQADVSDHKVEVARNYATNADVERAIDRVERAIERLGDALRAEKR